MRPLRVTVCFAVALAATACRGADEPAPLPFERALIDLARQARLEGLLPLDGADDGAERQAARRLGRIAARARAALRGRRDGSAVEALNRVVFDELGFAREVADDDLRFTLLPQVLAGRRGGCLGLSGLYLALGDRLGLPLRGVLVPGHVFVRFVGRGGPRDIELLRRGSQMPRDWYRRRYGVPAASSLYLRRALTREQTLAVFRYNLANAHRAHGSLTAALAQYRHVVRALPDFAEAQANLGLTLHKLGRLTEAERAYRRARGAHPELEGLQHNLEALRRQRDRPRAP